MSNNLPCWVTKVHRFSKNKKTRDKLVCSRKKSELINITSKFGFFIILFSHKIFINFPPVFRTCTLTYMPIDVVCRDKLFSIFFFLFLLPLAPPSCCIWHSDYYTIFLCSEGMEIFRFRFSYFYFTLKKNSVKGFPSFFLCAQHIKKIWARNNDAKNVGSKIYLSKESQIWYGTCDAATEKLLRAKMFFATKYFWNWIFRVNAPDKQKRRKSRWCGIFWNSRPILLVLFLAASS